MEKGWIKLHRKITEWEWYFDPLVFRLFIHILLTANLTDKKWRGTIVKRGQIITSYPELARQLTGKQQAQIGVQSIRTALGRLKSTGELTVKTSNKYTIITVQKYDEYQSTNTPPNKPATGNQQATNKRLTTTKEVEEGKNERMKEEYSATKVADTPIQKVVNHFFLLKGWDNKGKSFYEKQKIIYSRYTKPAKQLLELCDGDVNLAKEKLERIQRWADAQEIDWSIETVFKRWHDIDELPQEKKKKPHYEGNPMYQKNGKWFVMMPDGRHLEFNDSERKIVYV